MGQEFQLHAGVPQGSSSSPTLYTLYISDISQPGPSTTNIQHADDITQMITYQGKSRNFMAIRTVNDIEKINEYEKKVEEKKKYKLILNNSTELQIRTKLSIHYQGKYQI